MTSPRTALVSVIVPVYNEATTVAVVLDELVDLTYERADFEIVIVESNSSDGSRAIVEKYADHPRVSLVLQDEAQGKGNAVRAGFAVATGDIILIQDGDLEYRIAEYPLLLGPILNGETEFVLGCRHVRGQPMRDIPEQPVKGFLLNAAHWAFTALFDVTYGVRVRDPFTMFKVFRAECIEGMQFESNRFDFDWELIGKLVRRGYKPLEVPITYKARSFEQGKKVRLFRDPPTWIRACFRYRLCRIPRPVARRTIADVTDAVNEPTPLGSGDGPADSPTGEVDLRSTQVS